MNKAYVEKARLKAVDVVKAVHDRYLKQLIGRLAHCSSQIQGESPRRKYYYVPQEVEQQISQEELLVLEQLVKTEGSTQKVLEVFRDVLLKKVAHRYSPAQVKVLAEIHRQVQQKHRCPVFGRDHDLVLQIHLDPRVVQKQKELLETLSEQAQLLWDSDNTLYPFFLSLSHPVPRGTRLRLPLCLRCKMLERLGRKEDCIRWRSSRVVNG